ncbi:FAD-dependent oxidoreductase [Catenovulum sediminis]|uniref:FAD-dependent oxidoreductase n=1 Tax=Catenovulum sediminis TaxID=1740262 RepID=UPI00117E07C9|nr:FAD-dependent oxidoreductase [Catenovulum sediminis]
MIDKFDLVIVGAGIVGLTCALAVARTGKKIAVVAAELAEKRTADNDNASLDALRVSAINQASINAFCQLNVWQRLAGEGHTPFSDMLVWDKNSHGKIEFSAENYNADFLGQIVQNSALITALLLELKSYDNCQLYPHNASQLDAKESEPVLLQLDNNRLLQAEFLVAADGAHSNIRKWLDVSLSFSEYGQTAIVANIQTSEKHQNTARQIFTPSGPLAFLPLANPHQSSIVWSLDFDECQQTLALDKNAFEHKLAATFDGVMGTTELISERISFPLVARYSQQFIKNRCLLIGDAAHTIHPLAGQGANLGIMDALAVAECIGEHWPTEESLQTDKLAAMMRQTMRWRQLDALERIAAMEIFKRSFGSDFLPLKIARAEVMNILNHMTPVKNQMAKIAMGLSGKLPELAKKMPL